MSGIRPISRRLLPHTIQYEKYIGDDGWGSGGYEEAIEINRVRVEPKSSIRRNNTNEQVEGDYILVIDALNSNPYVEPKEKDKITFNGKKLEVKESKVFYAFSDKPHHLEVGLI